MKTYSQGLAFGIIFAVLFVVIYILVRKGRGKDAFEQFDERQLAFRGKAYQAGFFVFMAGIGIDACLKMMGLTFYEDPLGEFTALFAALIVFAAQAIRYDSFKGFNKDSRSLVIIYVIVNRKNLHYFN